MRIPRIMKASLVAFTLLSPATVSAQATSTTNTISTSIAATSTTDFILPTVTSSAPTVPTPAPAPTPSAGNSTLKTCPGPLINNTFGLNIPTCMGPCCIKCPAVNSFYEPNKVERVMNAAYVTRQVSMALSIFIAFSYMLLPGKRSQPHISVLFLSVSLSLWYISFDIMPGVSNACINEFEQSTGHNSKLCGVQGVLIIYFTQTSSLWCSLLIYKLHLLAVWRSDFVDRHYGWLTSFCWIFPLAFAIPVAVMNLSQYPGIGFSCLVSTANLNTYLFYPLAVYIYPAMLCHTVTVAKMIHLAILSSNIDTGLSQLSSSARMKITTTMQAKRLLRGQWRPALMVGTAMTSMLIFWLFYFVDAHRLADLGPTTPWIQQWVICVMTNGAKGLTSDETQTLCSKEISSNLPSIPWLTAAELVLALVGTVVALVFISKAEFWSDWAFLLSNIFRRGKLGHGSRGHGSPDGNLPNNAEHTARYNYNGSPLKKGTRVGYNDVLPGEFKNEHNPIVRREHQEGTQWYDMDDLLDKEYDLQGAELQRNMSYGSRTAMTSACGHQSSTQLPQYPSSSIQDPHSGDILYAPPVQESVNNNAWSSAAHSAVSPAETYLVANDNSDQYVDRPVIPLPVPRAKSKASHEQSREQQQSHPPIFLSSSSHSSTFPQKSLSPMPQKAPGKTSSTSLPRPTQPDSVPIVSGVWGSPATTYAQSSATAPSPSSSTLKATLYDLNDSSDKIMVASRESVGRAPIKTRQPQKQSSSTLAGPVVDRNNSGSSRISSRSKKSNPPSALDLHAKNSPPTIPLKSPARQQFQYQQYGHQNQGVSSPTSPTSPSRQYM